MATRLSHSVLSGVALMLLCSCGRINFDPLGTTSDAEPEKLELLCSPLVPISPLPPPESLIEPGLVANGLTLLARFANQDHIAVRGSPSEMFSQWSRNTQYLEIPQDHNFLDVAGEEIAAGAGSQLQGAPRAIVLCTPPYAADSCNHLTIFDSEGAMIADEVDGPSLALRDGELFMAFNRGTEVFFARPRSTDTFTWDATRIDIGAGSYGDPTLTNDGTILLVSDVTSESRIHLAIWDETIDNYAHSQVLNGISGGSPEIGVEFESGFEVIVVVDYRGVSEPHRTTCVY